MTNVKEDFEKLRDQYIGLKAINKELKLLQRKKIYLSSLYKATGEGEDTYPNQGLLKTPFDYLDYSGEAHVLSKSKILECMALRYYFLRLFNHPYRTKFLESVSKSVFVAPKKVESSVFRNIKNTGLSLSIADFGAIVTGSERPRASRTERYAHGPFVKLGKYARIPFVGSASPDVWNSSLAIATMAASHCMVCIPRNGVMADIGRQSKLALMAIEELNNISEYVLIGNDNKKDILAHWKSNLMGTLEADPEKALKRAEELFEVGIRTFRVYSPEPGLGPEQTTKALRDRFLKEIEIFVGQITDVNQAKRCEEAGADGLYVGIGGGGRCVTGVRSGSVVDWPELVWNLRGEINIPIIAEGGASDHVAVALLLGVSGIGVTRLVGGGTIESPGGAMYFIDREGRLFKPYGGEASARTKYLENKMLAFNIPSFVEGETTKAYISYIKHTLPTLTYNLHLMIEDAILALVFRNCNTISDYQNIDPSPLRQITSFGEFQKNTH